MDLDCIAGFRDFEARGTDLGRQYRTLQDRRLPNPPQHIVVFLTGGILDSREEVKVSTRSTDILGRAGVFSSNTLDLLANRRGHRVFFDLDRVLPAITEVIEEDEAASSGFDRRHAGKSGARCQCGSAGRLRSKSKRPSSSTTRVDLTFPPFSTAD